MGGDNFFRNEDCIVFTADFGWKSEMNLMDSQK